MTIPVKVEKAYANFGFIPEVVKGNSRWGEHMYAVNYDGVQYSIDHHGHEKDGIPDIEESAKKLQLVQNELHEEIKIIYNNLKKFENLGDIWVMSGGGSGIQLFIGNKSGYLAILYVGITKQGKLYKKERTLVVQWGKNDKYFESQKEEFKKYGINIRLHRDSHPDEEIDEDYDLVYG